MNKLASFSKNVVSALESQRSGALVVNLLLTQLQVGQPTLTTADCWTLVGGAGQPSKKNSLVYYKANSLQKTAKQISDILQQPAATDWDQFASLLNTVNFADDNLQAQPAYLALQGFIATKGCHAVNGSDIREFIATLRPASEQPSAGTAQGTEQPTTATASAQDTVSAEAGQTAGEIEAEKDLAASMLADLAQADNIVGKTVASLMGLDPVIAMQKMAQAWQADRARLLAEINGLTDLNEKAAEKVQKLTEQVRANRPAKAKPAMAQAMEKAQAVA